MDTTIEATVGTIELCTTCGTPHWFCNETDDCQWVAVEVTAYGTFDDWDDLTDVQLSMFGGAWCCDADEAPTDLFGQAVDCVLEEFEAELWERRHRSVYDDVCEERGRR